jgi:hypothetical protein
MQASQLSPEPCNPCVGAVCVAECPAQQLPCRACWLVYSSLSTLLVGPVHCCTLLRRPINDSTEPVEAEGPFEVIDPDTISKWLA